MRAANPLRHLHRTACRISGPQVNSRSAEAATVGREPGMFRRTGFAEFQHVAEHCDAPPRRLQTPAPPVRRASMRRRHCSFRRAAAPRRRRSGNRRRAPRPPSGAKCFQRRRGGARRRAPSAVDGRQRRQRVHRHVLARRAEPEPQPCGPPTAHRYMRCPRHRAAGDAAAHRPRRRAEHAITVPRRCARRHRQRRGVRRQHSDAAGLQPRGQARLFRRRSPRCCPRWPICARSIAVISATCGRARRASGAISPAWFMPISATQNAAPRAAVRARVSGTPHWLL